MSERLAQRAPAEPALVATAARIARPTRLAIAPVESPLEHEADRVADRLLAWPGGLLQRACACGGAPDANGECDECKARRLGLQRQPAAAGPALAPPIVHKVLASPSRPLEPQTRALFEPHFGLELGRVRVHTDARAAESAEAVGAVAYTVGHDIVFGRGAYAPDTVRGRLLIAHELAHVAQQAAGAPLVQRAPWWRGEGIGVPRVGHGPVIHDLGPGLYLADTLEVAEQYALLRLPAGQGLRILVGDIPENTLGRVLDLTKDARWDAYLQEEILPFGGGKTAAQLLRSGEPYWGAFQQFLSKNGIDINAYDTIIGPEYLRGGKQVCIRNPATQAAVSEILKPVPIMGPAGERPGAGTPAESYVVKTQTVVRSVVQQVEGTTIAELEVSFVEGLDDFNRAAASRAGLVLPQRMVILVQVGSGGELIAAQAMEGPAVLAETVARQALAGGSTALAKSGGAGAAAATAAGGSWLATGAKWGGNALFALVTAYQLYEAEPAERPRVLATAGGTFAGSAAGTYLVCNVIFAIETFGWSLVGCAFFAGGAAGLAGGALAGATYDVVAPTGDEEELGAAAERP